MNLAELIEAVASESVRPDLIDDGTIMRAVLSSTLKLHTIDLFPKDVQTSQITFDTPVYIDTIDTSIFPRYRRLTWSRKNDNTVITNTTLPPLGSPGWWRNSNKFGFLKVLSPDDILDEYGIEKTNVIYGAGQQLWFKSSTPVQFLLLAFYQYPNLDTTTHDNGLTYPNFSSWIAVERPYAIIFDATSKIFTTSGNLDQSRKYDSPATSTSDGGLVQNEIKRLLADNILIGDDYAT